MDSKKDVTLLSSEERRIRSVAAFLHQAVHRPECIIPRFSAGIYC